MSRFRIEYSKKGAIAYISHLDLGRMFERAARRAALPVALSQGFHPHYKMSFGSVLPVGVEGEREYLDIELNAPYVAYELQKALADQMPTGLKIRQVKEVPLTAPGLMALINAAVYQVRTRLNPMVPIYSSPEFKPFLAKALQHETWPVKRERKKGTREIDARSGLLNLDLAWKNGQVEGEICLKITPQLAIRPLEILEALEIFGNLVWAHEYTNLRRTGLFVLRGGKALSPMQVTTR